MRKSLIIGCLKLACCFFSYGQNNDITVYDFGKGYADRSDDLVISDTKIFINILYWDGTKENNGILCIDDNLDSLWFTEDIGTGNTVDDNMVTYEDKLVICGTEGNRNIKITKLNKNTGKVEQSVVLDSPAPQEMFITGTTVLDSQFVITWEGRHDTTTNNDNHLYLAWIDKKTLTVDTVVLVYPSLFGHAYELQRFGLNEIALMIDTIIPWQPTFSPWIKRQLYIFDGQYNRSLLYETDSLELDLKWGNSMVTLPDKRIVMTIHYERSRRESLTCIDSTGQFLWEYDFSEEWDRDIELTNLSVAANGDILASGRYDHPSRDAAMAFRLSPDGELLWIKLYNLPNSRSWMQCSFGDINQMDENRLIVAGRVIVTQTRDPTDGQLYPNRNTLIMTIDNDGCYNGDCSDIIDLNMEDLILTSIKEPLVEEVDRMVIYPNPVQGNTLYFKENVSGQIGIFDLTGKKIQIENLDNENVLLLDDLQSGIYILSYRKLDGNTLIEKIIVP